MSKETEINLKERQRKYHFDFSFLLGFNYKFNRIPCKLIRNQIGNPLRSKIEIPWLLPVEIKESTPRARALLENHSFLSASPQFTLYFQPIHSPFWPGRPEFARSCEGGALA